MIFPLIYFEILKWNSSVLSCSAVMTVFYLYKIITGGNHFPTKSEWWPWEAAFNLTGSRRGCIFGYFATLLIKQLCTKAGKEFVPLHWHINRFYHSHCVLHVYKVLSTISRNHMKIYATVRCWLLDSVLVGRSLPRGLFSYLYSLSSNKAKQQRWRWPIPEWTKGNRSADSLTSS